MLHNNLMIENLILYFLLLCGKTLFSMYHYTLKIWIMFNCISISLHK